MGFMMQNIFTPRLQLRRFTVSDAADLFDYLSNPRVNCFIDGKVSTMEQAIVEAEKRSQDDSCLAVCLQETGEVIGDLFLHEDDMHGDPSKNGESQASPKLEEKTRSADTYSVGWNFNAKYEGKGYASESAMALLDYLFMQKGVRRIYAYVEDDNYRSQALCKKLGMRQEGCFMEFVTFVNHPDGTPKYENTFQYAILKKEWLQRNH